MKCISALTLVVCTLIPALAHAQAPPPSALIGSCGQIRPGNTSHQWGNFGMWLEYIVSTSRDVNLCPLSMTVDAHVPGVSGSAMSSTGWLSASVRRQVPVPHAGRWQTNGNHAVVLYLPGVPHVVAVNIPFAETVSLAEISAPVEEYFPSPDPAWQCQIEGGTWMGWECAPANSPLIVDTARDGYKLTSVENGVRFDLNADGVLEQVAWTKRDSDDAFLAMDRNGNGRIDSGAELFGNHTPVIPADPTVTPPNGFEALKFLETSPFGPSERNEIIDANDAAYARLVLWRDLNHNGLSEPDELQPVSESGLAAIYTEYKNSKRVDRHGNEFRQRSKVLWSDGQYDHIFDIWLNWRD